MAVFPNFSVFRYEEPANGEQACSDRSEGQDSRQPGHLESGESEESKARWDLSDQVARGQHHQWDGPHKKDEWEAKAAKARKERELCGGVAPITGGEIIKEAIDAFVLERIASQGANSVRRWQWELDRITSITGKIYLREIDWEDVFAYWNSYKAQGAKPRTIHNRVKSLLTVLKNRGIVGLLKSNEMPSFDEKDVDYYTAELPDHRVLQSPGF
jgi:hypothetical protein